MNNHLLQTTSRPRALTALLVAVFLLSGVSSAHGQTIDTDATFERAMQLADQAEGRVERVKYLKQALGLRPNHPNNIVIEYRIGIALAQHGDPATNTRPNPAEAIPWFKRVIEHYHHEDYYENEGPTGVWDAQLLIPKAKAAVQLISSHVLSGSQSARRDRETALKALDALNYTYSRRRQAWLDAEEPQPSENPMLRELDEESRVEARRSLWRQHRQAAARGEVLYKSEMNVLQSAVSHFGYTFGPQKPWEVEAGMRDLIRRYPDTPIARVAQSHIDQAAKMTRELAGEIVASGVDLVDAVPLDDGNPDQVETGEDHQPAAQTSPADTTHPSTGDPRQTQRVAFGVIGGALLALILVAIVWACSKRKAGAQNR